MTASRSRQPAIACTCGRAGTAGAHAIDCMIVAAEQPNAMTNAAGDVFYPDNAADAAVFAQDHGAVFLADPTGALAKPCHPVPYLPDAAEAGPDDPAPTTGGPVDYDWPVGCVCHLRDDADWGEHFVAPPQGCPVHTPWAVHRGSVTSADGSGGWCAPEQITCICGSTSWPHDCAVDIIDPALTRLPRSGP